MVVSGVLALGIIAGSSYFMVGSWQAESMLEQTYAKLPYFYERMKDEDKNPFSRCRNATIFYRTSNRSAEKPN